MSKKRKWSYSGQHGKPGHCHMAQVWDENGNSLCTLEPTVKQSVATGRARLFANAREIRGVLAQILMIGREDFAGQPMECFCGCVMDDDGELDEKSECIVCRARKLIEKTHVAE